MGPQSVLIPFHKGFQAIEDPCFFMPKALSSAIHRREGLSVYHRLQANLVQ